MILQFIPFSTFETCCCVKCAASARSFWLKPAFLRSSCNCKDTSRSSFSSSNNSLNFSFLRDSLRCDLSVFIYCPIDFLKRHPIGCLYENIRQNDKISITEKVKNSDLVSAELDPQFMNPVHKKIGIGARKLRALLFKNGQQSK